MNSKPVKRKQTILMALLMFILLVPNGAGAQADFDRFVIFGTSLSDPGNLFAETHEVNVPPEYNLDEFFVPNAAYAIGGHHLTNGPTWIEQLATQLGMKASVLPASRDKNPGARNYATDGSRAVLTFHPPGAKKTLEEQIDDFLADEGGVAPAGALYVIEMGSNDVRDAVIVYLNELLNTGDPVAALDAANLTLSNALDEIAVQVERLHNAGAYKFLYMLAPALQTAPAIQNLDAFLASTTSLNPGDVIGLAEFLTLFFNFSPGVGLTTVFATVPGIDATPLDIYTLTLQIVASPEGFGLTNVEDACITPFNAPWKCEKPDEYLFWDVVHPSKVAHAIIAEEASDVLGIN